MQVDTNGLQGFLTEVHQREGVLGLRTSRAIPEILSGSQGANFLMKMKGGILVYFIENRLFLAIKSISTIKLTWYPIFNKKYFYPTFLLHCFGILRALFPRYRGVYKYLLLLILSYLFMQL